MNLTASARPLLDAFRIAEARSLLPTTLGSADLQNLGDGLWKQAFFSARTQNAEYLSALKGLVERYIQGGYKNDLGQLRVEARALLKQLGYDPATGFPEDFGHVPEAEAGSLQDLSSEKRLNLIFETQSQLARGLTQQTQGMARIQEFPAWELGRMFFRKVPRGSELSKSMGWEARFLKAGGKLLDGERMIGLKNDPVWQNLGSRELFPDALSVSHPPFAFNSGMGWRLELDRAQCVKLGLLTEDQRITDKGEVKSESAFPPVPKKLDDATRLAVLRKLRDAAKGMPLGDEGIREALRKASASNDATPLGDLMLLAVCLNVMGRRHR